ncbi:glycosyltransferase family 4 protein [Candidatus Woesearchaeota archaeon]|nr:glycosyltransferase family 4 protein [Candidatus Woesearchaeota archaeon]
MKILLICENYYPHYGGAEILFKNLAEGFAKKGIKTTVVTHQLKKTCKRENINGVEVHRVNSFYSRYIFSFVSIIKVVQLARENDIIQTTTFNGAFPAWIAAKLTRKPIVLTVHEVWQGKWQEITGFPRWKSKIHEFLESLIYRLSFDKYFCVSEATKKDLLANTSIPISSAEKISVISNGLDYDFWNKKNVEKQKIKEIREKYSLTDSDGKKGKDSNGKTGKNTKIFFSWGRPGASKGFEYLIQAMPAVVEKYPDTILLLMFGSKEKYPQKYAELVKLVQEKNTLISSSFNHLNINHIHILESQPYPELRGKVAAADAIVVPSISEGFGYAAREAMALEKPVIVSDAGSLPEVVGGKHWIFQKKNSKDLAEKMFLAAQEKWNFSEPKKFTWEECVEGYVKVYESL